MQAEEEFPPPPPERGSGQGSAENSFSDSNSTTQSNVTSECSEAECDREPLVRQRGGTFKWKIGIREIFIFYSFSRGSF